MAKNMFRFHEWRYPSLPRGSRARVVMLVVTLAGLMAMGSTVAASAQDTGTPPTLPGESDTSQPCFDGRLRIRDLEAADASLKEGVDRVTQLAKEWEEDARLFALRLGCPLLETGYQWEGTYFSESAQAFYGTDTAEIQAAEDDPETIPTLDTKGLSMLTVYLSLLRAGYAEDSLLGAVGGVTIRQSSEAQRFGPPAAPRGDIYYHVSVLERGEVIDVWIAASDGTPYRYEMEAWTPRGAGVLAGAGGNLNCRM